MSGHGLPPELEELVRRVVEAAGLALPARREVEREVREHFEDGLAAGVPPGELAARFGDPEEAGARIARARAADRAATRTRTWRSGMGWSDGWSEVRRSVRTLIRSPGYAGLVVVTLALGVGANTAVFTVLDAVFLEPLPYAEPDRLVRVYEVPEEDPASLNFLRGPEVAAFLDFDEVFEGFGALYTYREMGADLTNGDRPRRLTVVPAAAGYFETLGVAPALGRTFRRDESTGPGESVGRQPSAPVVILSHGLWQAEYGGDPGVLGRTIRLDGAPLEVVGVMPAGFRDPFGSQADAWTPQDLRRGGYNSWGNFYLSGVARLADGLDLATAQARLDELHRRLVEAEPEAGTRWSPRLVPLRDDVVGDTRRTMLLLMAAAAGLVLLSACVNVANLALARALGRTRDVALRAALGSGRARLLSGALTEAAVLALAGGALGVALGWVGVDALLALAPDVLPSGTTPTLGWRVLAAGLGATVLALLVFGLAPAVRVSSTPPAAALRQGERGGTAGGAMRRLRGGLVVAQVAVGLVLLAGAGLLGRSFLALRDVSLGVEPEDVLTFEVHLPDARYPDGDARQAFHERFQARVEALPGVEAVGATSWLPVNGRYHIWGMRWAPPGSNLGEDDGWYSTDVRVVAGDYFDAMGIEVVRGATPDEIDPAGEPVVWISRSGVEEVFAGEDPLGKVVTLANADRRVVGLVEDVAYDTRGSAARTSYLPHAQFASDRNWALVQTVRTRGEASTVRRRVEEELAALDPALVLYRPRPFEAVLAGGRARDTFATALMGVFATLALVLTLVGTYGVLAGAVAARRGEIGIRMALGADAGRVRRMVARYAALLTVPGIALGMAGAWLASRWMDSLLYGVGPRDPLVLAGAVAVLVTGAAVAAWLPARRATSVDPARTLSTG